MFSIASHPVWFVYCFFLFVSISQVIGCEDCLQKWSRLSVGGVKLQTWILFGNLLRM